MEPTIQKVDAILQKSRDDQKYPEQSAPDDAHVEFYQGAKVTQGLRLGDWTGIDQK